jgi:hypothetical protein
MKHFHAWDEWVPWQQMAWLIEDVAVFDSLSRNGYWYEECGGGSSWYRTNLPIAWNDKYEFSDGAVIESQGTSLSVIRRDLPPRPEQPQPKEEHPLQEIWDRVEALQG